MTSFASRARMLAGVAAICVPAMVSAQSAGAPAGSVPATDNPSVQAAPAPPADTSTTPAAASPAAAGTPGAASSAGNNIGFQEIVVTAQKRSENLQSVPIAVTALSTAALGAANVSAQTDLPKLTPTLSFTVNSGFASAYIRGVGTQFGNPGLEPSVSVYLDDVYLPRAGSALFSFVDLDRIEVLKGPQGTLYGRNATGGAIRLITKDPVIGKYQAKGQFTIGSYATRIYSGIVNVPLGDSIAFRGSAQHGENKGYVRNLHPGGDADGNTRGQNKNEELYTGKLLFDNGGPFKVKLQADYSRKDDRESVSEANLFPGGPEQIGAVLGGGVSKGFYTYDNDGQDSLHTKAYGGELRIDYQADNAVISSITGYRIEKEHNCADIDGTGAFVQSVCGDPKTRQFTQELQIASRGSGPLKYVAGLYYLHEISGYAFYVRAPAIGQLFAPPGTVLTATDPQIGLISGPNDNIRVQSVSPYAQIDWDFTNTLAISLGGRYTYESKRLTQNNAYLGLIGGDGFPAAGSGPIFPSPACTTTSPAPCNDLGHGVKFNELTYKATLSWKPMDKVLFYGTVSRGFKSGGLNTPVFVYSSQVKPETLQDYEVGWKTQFGRIRFNGAAYYYDYKNLQIAITNQATGGTDILNAASARIKGVESDVAWIPLDGLEFGAGGSYTDAKYKNYVGQVYYPCGSVAGLSANTPEAAAGKAAGLASCAGQGGLGLALVGGRDLSGNSLVNTPKWAGYVRGQYTYDTGKIGKFIVSAIANYRSVAYFDTGNIFRDRKRTMVSAKLVWTAPNDRFFASVYGENLLDVKYNSIQSPQSTGGWRVAAPPREIFGSVGVNF